MASGDRPSWDELSAAWENLRRAQARLNCYPACEVEIEFGGENFSFYMGKDTTDLRDNVLRCELPTALLRDILDRKLHWNNCEIGCLIRFNRVGPYLPDVHTLMSFFHLPRPV